MYIVAVVVVLSFLILTILAGGREVPEDAGTLFKPFYKCGGYLYRKVSLWFPNAFRSKAVEADLQRMYPGKSVEILQTEYYEKKFALCVGIVLVGSLLGAAAKFSADGSVILHDGKVTRGEYAEGEREIRVEADYDAGTYELELHVGARELSEAETNQLFEEMTQALPELIMGENESLEQVCFALELLDVYAGYPVMVEWKSNRPDVISRSGRVNVQGMRIPVELSFTLQYGNYSREGVLQVVVAKPQVGKEDALYRNLSELLKMWEGLSVAQSEWTLPTSWQGKEINWRQVVEDNSMLIGGGTAAVAVLVYLFADKDLHDKLEKRKRKLKLAYPELVHKLVLFMGAGMTIRGAFFKIANEVDKGSPICEEMLYTCHELNSGVSEGAAYEHFGKRTGMQEYVRLSTLLMQNLKRGNSTLLERLREEADRSSEERLQQSKKLSEEASTKLLLPMVMMLAVVMVMIMAPAFSAI